MDRSRIILTSAFIAMSAGLAAQAPVAVPIVGSPAAQQAPPQPAAPPRTPPGPPPAPGQPVTITPFTPGIQPAGPPAQPPQIPPGLTGAPLAPGSTGQRKLDLSFNGPTLSLDAQNVTLRDILAEWQRRNGCQFVNAEKITGGPLTIQFPAGTPELEALDSLMRDLAKPVAGSTTPTGYGYFVAPPAGGPNGGSLCGVVYILPTSRPTATASFSPSGASPMAAPLMSPGSVDDEIPPVTPYPPIPRPVPVPQPQPNPNQPGQPGQPSPNTPPPQSPGFGPQAPIAPGAGGRAATPPAPMSPPVPGRLPP